MAIKQSDTWPIQDIARLFGVSSRPIDDIPEDDGEELAFSVQGLDVALALIPSARSVLVLIDDGRWFLTCEGSAPPTVKDHTMVLRLDTLDLDYFLSNDHSPLALHAGRRVSLKLTPTSLTLVEAQT